MDQIERGMASGIPLHVIEDALDAAENTNREEAQARACESSRSEGRFRRMLMFCMALFGLRPSLESLTSPACRRGAGGKVG